MSAANKLARKELIDMVPYQSARRLQAGYGEFQSKIWLNANEAAGNGEYTLSGDCINRYPDFQPDNLINAYSSYSQLPANCILATRGADEGIELLIRTFCRAYQDNILICPPTYGMYAISAQNHGAGVIKVPLVDSQLDLDGLAAQTGNAKIVFLCSPGNPTGNLLSQDDVLKAIELFADNAIIVVDEAYIEFCPEASAAKWLAKYDNLVILRTLSKAFALAGLRCGFTLASPDIIQIISKVIAPYPVPAPIAEIASAALNVNGLQSMNDRVNQVTTLREQLISWLEQQAWCCEVFLSHANFVLFRCENSDTKLFVFEQLLSNDILIRDQSKQEQLANCLRISIGSESELELLKKTLTNSFQPFKTIEQVVE